MRSVRGDLPSPAKTMQIVSNPLKGLPAILECENNAVPEVETPFKDNDFFQLFPVGLVLVSICLLGYAAWRNYQSSKKATHKVLILS
jgi:hypothetical protein